MSKIYDSGEVVECPLTSKCTLKFNAFAKLTSKIQYIFNLEKCLNSYAISYSIIQNKRLASKDFVKGIIHLELDPTQKIFAKLRTYSKLDSHVPHKIEMRADSCKEVIIPTEGSTDYTLFLKKTDSFILSCDVAFDLTGGLSKFHEWYDERAVKKLNDPNPLQTLFKDDLLLDFKISGIRGACINVHKSILLFFAPGYLKAILNTNMKELMQNNLILKEFDQQDLNALKGLIYNQNDDSYFSFPLLDFLIRIDATYGIQHIIDLCCDTEKELINSRTVWKFKRDYPEIQEIQYACDKFLAVVPNETIDKLNAADCALLAKLYKKKLQKKKQQHKLKRGGTFFKKVPIRVKGGLADLFEPVYDCLSESDSDSSSSDSSM